MSLRTALEHLFL